MHADNAGADSDGTSYDSDGQKSVLELEIDQLDHDSTTYEQPTSMSNRPEEEAPPAPPARTPTQLGTQAGT